MITGALIGASSFGLLLALGNMKRGKADTAATLAYMFGVAIFMISTGALIGSFF